MHNPTIYTSLLPGDFYLSSLSRGDEFGLPTTGSLVIKCTRDGRENLSLFAKYLRKHTRPQRQVMVNVGSSTELTITWSGGVSRTPQWVMVKPFHFATLDALEVMREREQHQAAPAQPQEAVLCTRKERTVHGELVADRYYFEKDLPSLSALCEHGLELIGTFDTSKVYMCWRDTPLFQLKHVGGELFKPNFDVGVCGKLLMDAVRAMGGADAHWQDLGAVYLQMPVPSVLECVGKATSPGLPWVEVDVHQVYKYPGGMRALSVKATSDDRAHVHVDNVVRSFSFKDRELIGGVTGEAWPAGMVPLAPPALPEFACSEPCLQVVYQE